MENRYFIQDVYVPSGSRTIEHNLAKVVEPYVDHILSAGAMQRLAPPKHEGETVRLGNDAGNMAPDRVRDPRNERLHGPKRRKGALRDLEAEAVQDGCTPEEARRILTLQDYQDEDLCDELRDRGYHGEITKTKTIKI